MQKRPAPGGAGRVVGGSRYGRGMDFLYSYDGRPFKVDDDRMWDRDGNYVGKIVDDRVYDTDGQCLGEIRNERLAYNPSHASRTRAPHSARSNRSATTRSERTARSLPVGWEDFRG